MAKQDEALVRNVDADPVDRASALMRLVTKGRRDLVNVARDWLSSPESILRMEAINLLLVFWPDEVDAERVRSLLCHDPDPDVRAAAAVSLSSWMSHKTQERHQTQEGHQLLKLFAERVMSDDDFVVQRRCYEELLRHVRPDDSPAVPKMFDRDRDIDWAILQPWLTQE